MSEMYNCTNLLEGDVTANSPFHVITSSQHNTNPQPQSNTVHTMLDGAIHTEPYTSQLHITHTMVDMPRAVLE